jgi:hypothetical protein
LPGGQNSVRALGHQVPIVSLASESRSCLALDRFHQLLESAHREATLFSVRGSHVASSTFPVNSLFRAWPEGFTLPVIRGSSRSYAGLSELEQINSQFFSLIICASTPLRTEKPRGL